MIGAIVNTLRVANRPCRGNNLDLSRAADGVLPRSTRVGLAIHLFLCGSCRRFLRQMVFLRAAAKRLGPAAGARAMEHVRMPAETRARLEQRLRRVG